MHTTGLGDGSRVAKDDARVVAYGTPPLEGDTRVRGDDEAWGFNVGVLNMQTADNDTTPANNFTVLRASRDLTDNFNDPVNLAIIQKYTDVPPELIAESIKPVYQVDGQIDLESLGLLQDFFRERDLLEYDENFEPIPNLARSWELNADTSALTFHLRDDVYWHDGVKTTAQDLKFSYDLARDPNTAFPNTAFWTNYGAAEAVEAAGGPERRALATTLTHPTTAVYVVEGRVVPSSWVWRRLTRTSA